MIKSQNGQTFVSSDAISKQFRFKVMGKWLLLGIIVGVATGLTGVVFQLLLELLSHFLVQHMMGLNPGHAGGDTEHFHFAMGTFSWIAVLALPTLGGLVSGFFIFKYAPEAKGDGTDAAVQAYHKNRGFIRPLVPILKMFTAIITIGSGGSGGREGPISQIGAGVGSFLAVRLGLSTATRRRLLAAGLGAGISCMFRVPLAGGIFAAEVLYSGPDIDSEIILPAIVASIVAYSVYAIPFGWGHMFIEPTTIVFSNPLELLPYFILALVVSVVALIFVKTFYGISNFFGKLNIPNMLKPAIGGLATGALALGFLFVTRDSHHAAGILGTGYGALQDIFTNPSSLTILVLFAVGIGKLLATALTIGSGGSAGVFGPSMVIGGTTGYAMGLLMHHIAPGLVPQPQAYAIVGMAGFFSAAANTPLSTILFVSEITGSYELLLPTMWVSVIAYLIGRNWSIYDSQVPSRLQSPAHFGEYAQEFFLRTKVKDVIKHTRKFVTIPSNTTLKELFRMTEHTRQRLFPVVGHRKQLIGCFRVDDLTHALHHKKPQTLRASDLIHDKPMRVRYSDSIDKAHRIMAANHANEVVVVSDQDPGKVVGILTSADILLEYTRVFAREKLEKQGDGTEEAHEPVDIEL